MTDALREKRSAFLSKQLKLARDLAIVGIAFIILGLLYYFGNSFRSEMYRIFYIAGAGIILLFSQLHYGRYYLLDTVVPEELVAESKWLRTLSRIGFALVIVGTLLVILSQARPGISFLRNFFVPIGGGLILYAINLSRRFVNRLDNFPKAENTLQSKEDDLDKEIYAVGRMKYAQNIALIVWIIFCSGYFFIGNSLSIFRHPMSIVFYLMLIVTIFMRIKAIDHTRDYHRELETMISEDR